MNRDDFMCAPDRNFGCYLDKWERIYKVHFYIAFECSSRKLCLHDQYRLSRFFQNRRQPFRILPQVTLSHLLSAHIIKTPRRVFLKSAHNCRNFGCYTTSIGCHDFSKIAGNLFESCPAAKYNKTSKTCFEVLVFVRRDGVGSTLVYGVKEKPPQGMRRLRVG